MKPIYQNPKPELKKIRETLDELTKSVNDLCARVIVDKEVDLYGCCADEFAKFGD